VRKEPDAHPTAAGVPLLSASELLVASSLVHAAATTTIPASTNRPSLTRSSCQPDPAAALADPSRRRRRPGGKPIASGVVRGEPGDMLVTFTRREGGGSTAEFVRPDGVTVRMRSYDRKHRIPHDLAHLVAERAFRVERGVWGSLAGGVLFGSAEVVAGRRRHDDKARSAALLKANKDEIDIAELLAYVVQQAVDQDRPTAARALAAAWGSRRTGPPPWPADVLPRAVDELRTLADQWTRLPANGTLTTHWPLPRR
jgi:hypothetical protein